MPALPPVLYAEDDDNDLFLMERAFGKCQVENALVNASNGKLAVNYLAGQPPFADRQSNPLPCLVILDLKMPGKHGLDVLKWIKTESDVRTLPVVVFSSSIQRSDVERAYELGADGYLVKPGEPSELIEIVKALKEYWMTPARPTAEFVEYARLLVVPPPQKSA